MDILTEHEMRQLSVLTALPLGPLLVIVYIQIHIYSISLLQICRTAFVLKPVMVTVAFIQLLNGLRRKLDTVINTHSIQSLI